MEQKGGRELVNWTAVLWLNNSKFFFTCNTHSYLLVHSHTTTTNFALWQESIIMGGGCWMAHVVCVVDAVCCKCFAKPTQSFGWQAGSNIAIALAIAIISTIIIIWHCQCHHPLETLSYPLFCRREEYRTRPDPAIITTTSTTTYI